MTQPDSITAIIAEMREPENSGQFGPWQITAANIKDWADRLAALAGAAPVAWDTKEMVEVAAKAIFEHWNFGAPVAWVPRGNSLKQTEARAYAREAIDAIIAAAPHAPAKAREDGLRALYDAAAKGFHTSETCGPDGKYLRISKFQNMADLHSYEDAWLAVMLAAKEATA